MNTNAGDKYITTQVLDWINRIWSRFLSWLLKEEYGHQRMNMIGGFILGAVVVRLVPYVFHYAIVGVGALLVVLFAVGCLTPIALLIEWAFRKLAGR
jgi:hypothetical protein